MRNQCFLLPLPGFGAGDERERRWRCGCRWVQSLSECLPAQWRDCCVPIMGECSELHSPSHLSKTAAQQNGHCAN